MFRTASVYGRFVDETTEHVHRRFRQPLYMDALWEVDTWHVHRRH